MEERGIAYKRPSPSTNPKASLVRRVILSFQRNVKGNKANAASAMVKKTRKFPLASARNRNDLVERERRYLTALAQQQH